MAILRTFGFLFLLPGSLVLGALDISIESDGGVFRSLINMIFWGVVGVLGALIYMAA